MQPVFRSHRRPVARGPAVSWSVLGLTVVAVGGFIASYYLWFHYQPKALGYLPSDAQLVARLDVEAHALFAPFRRQIFPVLLERAPASGAASKLPSPGLAALLRKHTGINLGKDLRELVFARGADASRWVLLAGGLFRAAPELPQQLSALLDELGREARIEADGAVVLPGALTVGQTRTGVLVLASSPELYAEVLRGSSRARDLHLGTLSPLWVTATAPFVPRASHGRGAALEWQQWTAQLYQHSSPRLQLSGEGIGAEPPSQAQMLALAAFVFAPLGLSPTTAKAPEPPAGSESPGVTVWLEWSEQATEQVLGLGAGTFASVVAASLESARSK